MFNGAFIGRQHIFGNSLVAIGVIFGLDARPNSVWVEDSVRNRVRQDMAKKGNRVIVTLECTEARELGVPPSRYTTTKNKKSFKTKRFD